MIFLIDKKGTTHFTYEGMDKTLCGQVTHNKSVQPLRVFDGMCQKCEVAVDEGVASFVTAVYDIVDQIDSPEPIVTIPARGEKV